MKNNKRIEDLESRVKVLEEKIIDLNELAVADSRLLHLVYKKLVLHEENTKNMEEFYDKIRSKAMETIERKNQRSRKN